MAFSHARRVEAWLRAADILVAVVWVVVAYRFPENGQFQTSIAWAMTAGWYFGLLTVGGQNPAYLLPRVRIVYSMLLSLGFASLIGILWAGDGHEWYMDHGAMWTLAALGMAGTASRFLIAIILQRPAVQLIPCRIPVMFLPLLEEIAGHEHIFVESILDDPAGPLPERRPGYPIYQVITDLRVRESDYQALMPLYARVEIVDLCDFYESLFGKVAIVRLKDEWVLPRALRVPSPIREMLSRSFDTLVVLLTAPLTLFVVGLGALAIKLTSPGPIFFTQERLGRYGVPFRIRKLRTMRTDAEAAGQQWSGRGDPRVTGVGRFLRATGIDELPQLLNVLRGEMRLIGPRPETPDISARLMQTIPFYEARLLVLPGLAGWAQLHQGGDTSDADVLNKVRYDLFYLKYGSFLMDLRIFIGTVQMLLHLAKPKPKAKSPAPVS